LPLPPSAPALGYLCFAPAALGFPHAGTQDKRPPVRNENSRVTQSGFLPLKPLGVPGYFQVALAGLLYPFTAPTVNPAINRSRKRL
jgi:hypothetical protein